MQIELVYRYPDGREEVKHRCPRDSWLGQDIVRDVIRKRLAAHRGGYKCPYKIRKVQ